MTPIRARIRVPGDKSISHRAVLLAAMAAGESRISGLLDAEDVGRTVQAVRQLGCDVSRAGHDVVVAGGAWRDGGVIDCGNSGTTARLLAGALAGRAGGVFDGDASLRARPMARVIEPLRAMGADISGGPRLPLTVRRAPLAATSWTARVASAQVKSAILLAGLHADGETTYVEPVATRDHTERMLRSMGAPLDVDGPTLRIRRGSLRPGAVTVPGDLSSAAFWLVAAALSPGSDLVVEGVGLNPGRTGVLRVLERMGLELEVMVHGGAEPAGDVRARGGGLRGTRVAGGEIPTLIDEIPALAVAAAFAEGVTVFADAAELRAKESDRITAVVAGLRAIGVEADERPDGMVVRGGGARAGAVASRGDHRIAMAFAIAGLRVPVHVPDTACVATSYPGFFAELERMRG